MNYYTAEGFDILVIGAGHAGIEAALASARMGLKTALFTLSNDLVGNMPCNPAVGGTGKGHLVFELDALGGEMGRAANHAMLQSRMLNSSKGPAVRSLRLQTDRVAYRNYMKKTLEEQERLTLIQGEITDIGIENGVVSGAYTSFGGFYPAKAVVIATGTSLAGRIIVGEASYTSGPDNTLAATGLSQSLLSRGVSLRRFKTGTPPRIHADSIDYDLLEKQDGDDNPVAFGYDGNAVNLRSCWVAYTNEETHRIIRANLSRSPLFSGEIKGTGPRYCPSIEDKVVRFPDKERHQIFVEPMGQDCKEMYLQGLSSSLPEEIQKQVVHSIKGLEHAVFMRTAYAIEYDCCDPTELKPTLEMKAISGLYGAGQFNGSSGYEEAAVQGLVAGINAALKIQGKSEMIFPRSESYIGTLIDDLVTKGTNEPYRIMTSRSEYRLLLRQDNAKARMCEKGFEAGLISEEEYNSFLAEEKSVKTEIKRLETTTVPKSAELDELLLSHGYDIIDGGINACNLLRRPAVTIEEVYSFIGEPSSLPRHIKERVCTEVKYEGYIRRQLAEVSHFSKYEKRLLPEDIDYLSIKGLRIEAAQKLQKLRPESIGRAMRISGVSPADISVLMIYLKTENK